jgi:hypothetical protein
MIVIIPGTTLNELPCLNKSVFSYIISLIWKLKCVRYWPEYFELLKLTASGVPFKLRTIIKIESAAGSDGVILC